ncbi:MAG: carbohydrate kinase family protein [Caldilineaceae bacterium]
MTQVYCSGNLVADVQAKTLEQLPPEDVVAIVDEIELILGGNAANAAACLARMGVESAVIGRIGADAFGQFVRNELTNAGVNTEMMLTTAGAKTAATVAAITPSGNRKCAHVPGVTERFTAQDFDWARIEAEMATSPTARPRFLHFSSFFLLPGFDGNSTAQVLQKARQLGLRTSLDVCWDPNGRWAQELAPCLPYCDLIFPNQSEAQQITGRNDPDEMAQWLLDRGVRTAVIKLGAQGCLVKSASERVHVPGYRVAVVDTTGAGDAFAGGFLAAQTWGWDWEQTAHFACALAAISVTDFGVTRALQSKEQVVRLMRG